jgi:hypothetical protein
MPETSEIEFDWLKIRARNVDMFVGRHKDYDPVRGGGDLFLEVKERAGIREPAVLTYANEDEIHAALAKIEKQFFAKRA